MAAYQWKYRLDELPSPAIIRRAQYEQIKRAIEELQRYAITSVRCDDNTVTVKVDKGEAIISAGGAAAADDFNGTMELCQVPDWTDPDLRAKPVTVQVKDGKIVSATVGDWQTIDTAEACP